MEAIRCLKRYITREVLYITAKSKQAGQQHPDNGLTLRRASRAVIIRVGSVAIPDQAEYESAWELLG